MKRKAIAGLILGAEVSVAAYLTLVVWLWSVWFVDDFQAFQMLAAVGLGAVISLAVAERRRELAIRAALGAGRRQLRGVVLRESGLLTGVGICVGLLGALALGRAVAHLLVGVVPYDPLALSTAAALCAAAAALASWMPARRAADADPIEALRSE